MSFYYSPRKEQERNAINKSVNKFLETNSIKQLQPQENTFGYHLNAELGKFISHENIDDFHQEKNNAASIFDQNDYELNSQLVGHTNELSAKFVRPYQQL